VIPPLHIVTDDQILSREDFLQVASLLLEEGRRDVAFHLRGPRTTGRTLFGLAETLKGIASGVGGTLLVNDRVDLALALDLGGVHLGQRSLPPRVARGILGPNKLLGLSVHGPDEATEGVDAADFLLVGTIYASPSHPSRAPGGVVLIRQIGKFAPAPLLAIGGVTPERVSEVQRAGAYGVAVRGGVWDATDPRQALRGYLRELTTRKGR
jgi:thiamine-phosphate pyrophosphorylase